MRQPTLTPTHHHAPRFPSQRPHRAASAAATLTALSAVALLWTTPGYSVAPRPVVPTDSGKWYAASVDAATILYTPYATAGLVAQQVADKVDGLPGVQATTTVASGLSAPVDGDRGQVMRFQNGGQVKWSLPVALMAPTTQIVAGQTMPFGLGMSLFFRHHGAASERVEGWMPLASMAKSNQTWQLALFLRRGVPVLARRNQDGTLFDLGSVAVGFQPKLRVDDGKWHHLVVNVQQTPNPSGCGGASGAACAGAAWVRLVVDGAVSSEYTLDVGNDLRDVYFGSLAVTSGGYGTQPNWQASPAMLLTRGSIDDAMVYRRALTEREISQLNARQRLGLVALWPTLHPSLIGQTAVDVPGAHGQSTPSPAVGVVATVSPLYQVGGAHATNSLSAASDLSGTAFTSSTVVRGNGQFWLHAVATTSGWLAFFRNSDDSIQAMCGNGALTDASYLSPTQSTQAATGTPTDRYVRLAIIQGLPGGKTRFVADGRVRELACGTHNGAGLKVYGRVPGTPAGQPAAHIAQALLFRRAMPLDELMATAFPGPAIWVQPTGTSTNGLLQVREPNAMGAFWTGYQASNPAPPGGVLTQQAGQAGAFATFIGGSVLDPFLDAGADRPFTVAARFKVDKVGSGMRNISLIKRRAWDPWLVETEIRLICDYGVDGCVVYVMSPGTAAGQTQRQWRVDRILPYGVFATVVVSWPTLGLTDAGDGLAPIEDIAPRVSINGELENKVDKNDPNHLIDTVKQFNWKPFGEATRPAIQAAHAWTWYAGGELTADKLTISDMRVYPYAVQDIEAVYGRCNKLSCGAAGRLCTDPDSNNLDAGAICYGCDAGHKSIAGVGAVDLQCVPKAGFNSKCAVNSDCLSDRCDVSSQRCMASDANKADCDKLCFERGRQCVTGGAGSWRCGDCQSGFKRLPAYDAFTATHPDLECTWVPFIEDGEPCTNSAQCKSALCVNSRMHQSLFPLSEFKVFASQVGGDKVTHVAKPIYDGWAVKTETLQNGAVIFARRDDNRCLGRTVDFCGKEQKVGAFYQKATRFDCAPNDAAALSEKGSPKDEQQKMQGIDTYFCTSGCAPSFTRQWTVMSPHACSAILQSNLSMWGTSGTAYSAQSYGAGNESAFRAAATRVGFDLNDLKRAVLHNTSNYNDNADYANLVGAGIGRILIEYARGDANQKQALRNQYGDFGALHECHSKPAYTGVHNREACEPKLMPNGSDCPPPGLDAATLAKFPKHAFCKTNYCARDTAKCDNGDNPVLEPRASAGNQDRAGGQDTKFGLVRCDDTTIEQQDAEKKFGDDDYRYVADLTIAYCLRMFGAYVPPFPLLQGLFHLDRTEAEACANYTFTAYIAGIPIDAGEPKSLFGECTGMKITDNTVCEQAACTPGPLITGNLSELFNALKGGAYIQVGGAAPGCLPLEGTPVGELIDKLTILKTKVIGPIPLAVQFGPTLDICIDPLVGIGDEGVPKITIRPSVGLGVDARGGIGLAEGQGKSKAVKFWAGIELLVDIVKLGFPIGWGVDVKDIPGQQAMWKLELSQRIGIDLELLSGSFALFAEVALGPISIGFSLKLFNWTGFLFEWELSNVPLWSTKLDNRKPKITTNSAPDHNHQQWFGGGKCEGLCK